ncbi:Fc receptor-like protein 5 [Huso huso]|uniref:Fc receptor-like protein 5 n=1 Tax=Huso huso TaxID=61971 RepID=A0ABR0YZP8_HUSHU
MQACEVAALILLTVVSCSRQYEEGHPQAVLTLQPAWAQIFTGKTVTLSCEVEGDSADWRFKQYRAGREEAGCSDQYSRRYGDSCTISKARYHHSGVYWCESASGQERSNAVTLTVSNRRVFLQTPPQPVIEGDTLTLRCHVYHYTATRVVFYKDNEELQSRAGIELSVDSVSKSDEGFYKCRAEWWNSSTYSGVSAQVRVSVRGRFILTERVLTPFSVCNVSQIHSHWSLFRLC